MRHKSVNTPLSHERLVGGLQDGGRGTNVTHFVQLYPQPLYTASQVRTTCRSWDEGVLTDVCLTGVLTDLCLTLYYNIILLWDQSRIWGSSLTETSLCGVYLYWKSTYIRHNCNNLFAMVTWYLEFIFFAPLVILNKNSEEIVINRPSSIVRYYRIFCLE